MIKSTRNGYCEGPSSKHGILEAAIEVKFLHFTYPSLELVSLNLSASF